MGTYRVQVQVTFDYEIEAESREEAEEQGWAWEDYKYYADVESIRVEEIESDEDGEDA